MSNVILITTEQLKFIIKDSVREALNEQNPPQLAEVSELMNAADAAKFVGIAKQTLYGYTSKRLIPFIKRGAKTILFRRADLQSWLMEGKKATIAEINKELDRNER